MMSAPIVVASPALVGFPYDSAIRIGVPDSPHEHSTCCRSRGLFVFFDTVEWLTLHGKEGNYPYAFWLALLAWICGLLNRSALHLTHFLNTQKQ